MQHHAAERLERAIATMVVGWRIQLMVQLGREVPELPGELLFSDGELRVLATFARSRTLPPPTRLGDAVGLVGRLGGWLGRTRDPPGAQLMWHGYTQLVAMAFAYALVGVQPDQLLCFTYGYRRAAKWRRLKAASMMLVERGSSTPCSGGKARRDEGGGNVGSGGAGFTSVRPACALPTCESRASA